MWHLIHLVAVPIAFLLGLFCVLTAIVLYPGEEGKIQSKLEDFWIRVDDLKHAALSRHTTFMIEVSKLETKLLDTFFGKDVVSGQLICVSFACSGLSVLLVGYWGAWRSLPLRSGHSRWSTLLYIGIFWIVSICLLLRVLNTPKTRGLFSDAQGRIRDILSESAGGYLFIVRAFGFLVISMVVIMWAVEIQSLVLNRFVHNEETLRDFLIVYVAGVGCLFDLLFVMTIRALLANTIAMISSPKIMLTLLSTLALACAMCSPFILATITPKPLRDTADVMLYMVGTSNLFDVALALLFGLLVSILLMHSAVWPLLTRTLFRMQDIGTKGRRGILVTVGLALLGWSGAHFPELVKDLVKALGKG